MTPAKFSRNLISRIYEHVVDEGWVTPGVSTILDPFGGVALGAYEATRRGLQWVGIELEAHFVDMGRGCDCTGISKADYVRFFSRWGKGRYTESRHWCPRCMAQVGQVTGERTLTTRTFRTAMRPRRAGKPHKRTGRKAQMKTVRHGAGEVETLTRPFAPLCFPDRRDGIRPPRVSHAQDMFGALVASYERGSGQIPHTTPHHYEGNIEKWAREGYGGAVLLQGDSRALKNVIESSIEWCECEE